MFAEVVVDVSTNSLDKIFDYKCPESVSISLGQRVLVPFGKRCIEGYVLNLKDSTELEPEQVKEIIKPLEESSLVLPEMLSILPNIKNEYNLRVIDILHLIIPAQIRSGRVKQQTVKNCFLTEFGLENLSTIKANSKNQISACNHLRVKPTETITNLNKLFGSATINKLIEKGFIDFVTENVNRTPLKEVEAYATQTLFARPPTILFTRPA